MVNMTYGQSMTDNQVVEYAIQLKKSGASESDIAAKLMQRGATMDQIQRVRKQYAKQMTTKGLDDSVDNMVGNTKEQLLPIRARARRSSAVISSTTRV